MAHEEETVGLDLLVESKHRVQEHRFEGNQSLGGRGARRIASSSTAKAALRVAGSVSGVAAQAIAVCAV